MKGGKKQGRKKGREKEGVKPKTESVERLKVFSNSAGYKINSSTIQRTFY
jgi:hypothetical protein